MAVKIIHIGLPNYHSLFSQCLAAWRGENDTAKKLKKRISKTGLACGGVRLSGKQWLTASARGG